MRRWVDPRYPQARATISQVEGLQREQQRLEWMLADLRLDLACRKFALKGGFNSEQPRDELGRWTDAGEGETDTKEILAVARRIVFTTSPVDFQRCLDLCYPLLERRKRPGSDRNTWDFVKCMNACLGIGR